MTYAALVAAFGDERYRTADELALALERSPGKRWQRQIANVLFVRFNIHTRQVMREGKRRWVYDAQDFVLDELKRPRGSLSVKIDNRRKKERRIAQMIQDKLDALRRENLPPREKWKQLGCYIDYYVGMERRD